MTDVAILVPFRNADGARQHTMEWITARWRHVWPDAELIMRPDDGCDPFNKSMALNACRRATDADVLILLDADTWCERPAIEAAVTLAEQTGRLILPGRAAMRLNAEMTDYLLDLDPCGPIPEVVQEHSEGTVRPVGFLHVVTSATFDAVNGYDERFRGWGGEDTAFIAAMETLVGPPIRLDATLWSLWHPRPREAGRRIWQGQTDRNMEMLRAYTKAKGRPDVMRTLVGV